MHTPSKTFTFIQRQRGAALMVMLVIMIVGTTAVLVTSLNKSGIKLLRDQTSEDVLARAKDALIGYAAKDLNRPGELPCPDFNNDGVITPADDYNGSNCKSLVGWLPWKSLGLPDLRDANGERLWYAVADTFRASSTAILNSDAPVNYAAQMLSVNDGTSNAVLESGVVAIVFSPGSVLTGETRNANDNNASAAIQNYLEGENNNLDTIFKTANDQQNPAINPIINDRLLTISAKALLQPVEIRVAREARSCLEQYATTSGGKYPWAAHVVNNAVYSGEETNLFGRIPDTPNVDVTTTTPGTPGYTIPGIPLSSSADPNYGALNTAMNNLASAINACTTSDSSTNKTNLQNGANSLQNLVNTLPNPPYTASFKAQVNNLTSLALTTSPNACWMIENNHDPAFISDIQSALSSAQSGMTGLISPPTVVPPTAATNVTLPATGMQPVWTNGCFGTGAATLGNNPYWANWKSFVFLQIDNQYKPSNTAPIPPASLKINNAGAYRAVVLVGRAPIAGGPARDPTNATTYLEAPNQHSLTAPITTFESYNPSAVNFITVNDLVLCLDGSANCMQ